MKTEDTSDFRIIDPFTDPLHPMIQRIVTREKNDKTHRAVTIGRTPEELFSFWRNFANLSHFMKDIAEVRVLNSQRSHWVVELKSGKKVEWDAVVTNEIPGHSISWQSLPESDIETSGTVTFHEAPQNLGTVVSLKMNYGLPGGRLTEAITLLTGEHPDLLAFINLRRLKAYLETGEIPTIQGQSSGRDEDQSSSKYKH